ncbi:putative metallo-dependent phosphatases-like protein [Thermococcus cleftensis]|uniref:Metallo-dependent phosphatases-like protein n=1 Tax=Thermococcus cleftensis (strain DSM 27260 / KACC 17922 / CL1) TaxID=163003 RepID=I3ZRY6_THECF|nr:MULTISPECIES: metallophosphoesterase [Thermococcus]AFL94470.1 putative metallo-dependent phosphatases-like protein [Thermococcus cleftensis]NJE03176.1 metallophosphoesterase [Thermococcus sp. MV11]
MPIRLPLFRKKVLDLLASSDETKVMHVSDTPESVYRFIGEVIEKTQPDHIVHTGDLADNIKLERRPELKPLYIGAVRKLARVLKSSGAKLYVVPGNEDDYETVNEFFGESVVDPGTVVEIEGTKLALGHTWKDVVNLNADFRLYGHNFKLIERGLNGVLGVNFILLPSRRTYRVKYPGGTDFDRGYKMWRGL